MLAFTWGRPRRQTFTRARAEAGGTPPQKPQRSAVVKTHLGGPSSAPLLLVEHTVHAAQRFAERGGGSGRPRRGRLRADATVKVAVKREVVRDTNIKGRLQQAPRRWRRVSKTRRRVSLSGDVVLCLHTRSLSRHGEVRWLIRPCQGRDAQGPGVSRRSGWMETHIT
eukprot:284157-Chlamydomonas_euryale.AAC.5